MHMSTHTLKRIYNAHENRFVVEARTIVENSYAYFGNYFRFDNLCIFAVVVVEVPFCKPFVTYV